MDVGLDPEIRMNLHMGCIMTKTISRKLGVLCGVAAFAGAVQIGPAAATTYNLCVASEIPGDALGRLRARDDFADLLAQVIEICPEQALLITEAPTASIGQTATADDGNGFREPSDRDFGSFAQADPEEDPSSGGGSGGTSGPTGGGGNTGGGDDDGNDGGGQEGGGGEDDGGGSDGGGQEGGGNDDGDGGETEGGDGGESEGDNGGDTEGGDTGFNPEDFNEEEPD